MHMNHSDHAHKLPENPGTAAFVVILAVLVVFFAGIPQLWWFLASSIVLGVGITIVLRLTHG